MLAKFTKEYSLNSINTILANMISALEDIGELEIDQIDMKYELGLIFQDLRGNGVDVMAIFAKGSHFHSEQTLLFIRECYAGVSVNLSRKKMQELRETSGRIFLRDIDNMIPIANKRELTTPVWNISQGVLDWNERVIEEAISAMHTIATIVEKKVWNQPKLEQTLKNFEDAYNNDIWPEDKYIDYFTTVLNELPIVWELLEALFIYP